jgi:hypothetical protein
MPASLDRACRIFGYLCLELISGGGTAEYYSTILSLVSAGKRESMGKPRLNSTLGILLKVMA